MNQEFAKYKEGMLTGNAMAYETIAKWIEEDLAAERSFDGYPEVLRRHAKKYREDAAKAITEPLNTYKTEPMQAPDAMAEMGKELGR